MKADIKDHLLRIRWRMLHLSRRQVYSRIYKAIRPASSPYISGDGFRRLGRQVFDETCQSLDPAKVKNGDVVFVSTDLAVRFFREIDPGIRASYRLITHNSDVAVDAALTRLVTDKVELWFAQNNSAEHDRVVPIPIGLENLHHYNAGVPRDFDSMRTYDGARKNRVLAAFTIGTNPGERNRAHEIASKAACVEQLGRRLPQKDYLRTLVTYRFLLGPPGNGLDTHRTWEAMYLGVVPVVKDFSGCAVFSETRAAHVGCRKLGRTSLSQRARP